MERGLARRLWIAIALANALTACATASPGAPLPRDVSLTSYRQFEIPATENESGKPLPSEVTAALSQRLRSKLLEKGFVTPENATAPGAVAVLRSSLVGFESTPSSAVDSRTMAEDRASAKLVVFDQATGRALIDFAASATDEGAVQTEEKGKAQLRLIDQLAATLADSILGQFRPASASKRAEPQPDVFTIRNETFSHSGDGRFAAAAPGGKAINLKQIRHSHDPAIDSDVMPFTNVTLNDQVPRLVDNEGRDYALITLYNIDPPLDDLPSREAGIDRGTDFRDPANLVKGAYSNYVSPVFTHDEDGRSWPVAGHPIGHFLVKLELPGYPTVLTGMTTTKRADEELADLTLGRQLGIGGVLMTPQPGRLNSAAEALEELSRRQRPLVVTDGRYYRNVGGKNVGPTYLIEDGNVVFARFKLPPDNARDALRVFLEYVQRGTHNIFGSIINRPHKGTGAGCSAFAFSWLKGSGVVPFVDESEFQSALAMNSSTADGAPPFWSKVYRQINMPWAHLGCDDRVGLAEPQPAQYTVFDDLFYRETTADLIEASQGLTAKIRSDIGVLGATLFQFGAFTPLRDIVINSRRKDPRDLGDYSWSPQGAGLAIGFWDNGLFSDWVKGLWREEAVPAGVRRVREGRFIGIEIDAMDTARQRHSFFQRAEEIAEQRRRLSESGSNPATCEAAFALGIQ